MSEIQLEIFQRKHLRSYAEFAEEVWGRSCYQSLEKYVNWLHQENPCRKGSEEDFLLGLADGNVVGCIHKMRLMWRNKGRVEIIPAIHNLVISEKYRKQWFGIKMLRFSFSKENHVLVPGVARDQGNLYKFLGCQQVSSCWYRKILTPVKGAFFLGLKKVLNFNIPSAYFTSSEFKNVKHQSQAFKVTIDPSEIIIKKIISQLNKKPSDTLSVYWTLELFRWRFFHPSGPKHLLVYKDSEHDIEDFLILSLGPRRGLNVARVVEMEASSSEVLKHLMQTAERIIIIFRGHILLVFSSSQKMNDMLHELKYKLVKNSPNTYFYHKNKNDLFQSFSFNGSAGDFGFEAIPLKY